MRETSLCPLRFKPIYRNRLWGGRLLASWLTELPPGDAPIRRDDLVTQDPFDVYYEMAGQRIGMARLDFTDLSAPGAAGPPEAKAYSGTKRE
jgi:hypothetical protein